MVEITPGRAYGFFTDTSVCIGCKACEVACKQWNELPGHEPSFLDGFDNTGSLDSQNWRHVEFIDNVPDQTMTAGQGKAWLMMSDVCKHCTHASCMEVCPTGAIIRTEFDTRLHPAGRVQRLPQLHRGLPVRRDRHGRATRASRRSARSATTGCRAGMEPACAKACPTQSIQFGPVDRAAREGAASGWRTCTPRASTRRACTARDDSVYGGLNAFFLLMDEPEAYRLPNEENAVLPSRNNARGYLATLATAVVGRARRPDRAAAAPGTASRASRGRQAPDEPEVEQ